LTSEEFETRPAEELRSRIQYVADGPHSEHPSIAEHLMCAAARILLSPVILYSRWRAAKRRSTRFDAVNLQTLEDIGLVRNHIRAVLQPDDAGDFKKAA
jgi:uncharacterized protein YjiS (DUF1127 family)